LYTKKSTRGSGFVVGLSLHNPRAVLITTFMLVVGGHVGV